MKILIVILAVLAENILSHRFIHEDKIDTYNIGWLVGAAMVVLFFILNNYQF